MTWDQLTAKAQNNLRLINCRDESQPIVAFKVRGGVGGTAYLPLDVFEHCYFSTLEEMIAAYEARKAA